MSLVVQTACGFTVPASHGGDAGRDNATPDDAAAADGAPDAHLDAAIDASGTPITASFPITQDTNVDSLNPTTTYGAVQAVLVDGPPQTAVILMRSELSSIPSSASVQVVTLHIWTSQTLGDSSSIYDVLEAWDEASAIWALRATGQTWAGTGASPPSRGTVVRGTIPAPQTQYTETVVALDAAAVGGWVAQPGSNYGFAIVTTGSNGTGFRSREDTTAGRRPYLTITYRP